MSEAQVDSEDDPRVRGRTAYRIIGDTPEQVQSEITRIMNGEGLRVSEFTNPVRIDCGKYGSLGYTIRQIFE
jgi:hypothetical protein